ncbi:MAG: NAD(P)H-binding protein [Sphingobium sp.]|uniref:NAD(P)-dependent oxidoreductase n=1 Tax=Sphingobium TaxID=165695 RepID=UPI001A23BD87|nr:NAD(P)H-binding protein [Sphingobium sp.]MBJ7375893.1 NAD(P)H-binding protein [Sphingobium sp.]MBJ7445455.1 NAD(P)H-binding protein [Sphingobium sp.]
MKIALTGATGYVGGQILAEALSRPDIVVTAFVRDPSKLPTHDRLRAIAWRIDEPDAFATALAGHDALIHAFHPGRDLDEADHEKNLSGHRMAIATAKKAGVWRFLAVGGAASLHTPDGLEYIDSPIWDHGFDEYLPAIRVTRALYYLLKPETELDWVVVAPSSLLRPSALTRQFRYGKDDLLYDADGISHISLEDYAYAMIEEAVDPKHHRERFTVGY